MVASLLIAAGPGVLAMFALRSMGAAASTATAVVLIVESLAVAAIIGLAWRFSDVPIKR
jgi:hypothetical protein